MRHVATGWITGVLAALLALEVVGHLLPVSSATKTGVDVDPKVVTYPPRHVWTSSFGWDLRHAQRQVANSHGFAAAHDFVRDDRAVALIGDSHVEAASLALHDRPAAQLERALGGRRPVYAMGGPGTSLLDYAERMRWAHERFGVRDFVLLLERGDALQALCGSGNVGTQCLDRKTLAARTITPEPPSTAKRLLRESALAQYLTSQLKVQPATLAEQLFPPPAAPKPAPAAPDLAALDAVLDAFVQRVQPYAGGRLVVAVDADRAAIRQQRTAADAQRRRVIERLAAAGITVVDLAPVFEDHFRRSALSLDVSPSDGHFNALGARLIAQAVAREFER